MPESEIWEDVVGYEGFYKASNKGNVYSVERKDSRGNKCGGRTLSSAPHNSGYIQVGLSKIGIKINKYIHRLVAEAFVPNPNNYLEVNHLDEDKTNNNAENLEWCTRKYNVNYGTAIERATQTRSKKVKAINIKTGEVLTFSSTIETSNKGYSRANVSLACRGVYKNNKGDLIGGDGHTYRGYQWSYEEVRDK